MKAEMLEKLGSLEKRLRKLRADVKKLTVKQVGKLALRNEAVALADMWVEELRSPLEFKFRLPPETIGRYADGFKKLHVLGRPSNLASSYVTCLNGLLAHFKDDLVLPRGVYGGLRTPGAAEIKRIDVSWGPLLPAGWLRIWSGSGGPRDPEVGRVELTGARRDSSMCVYIRPSAGPTAPRADVGDLELSPDSIATTGASPVLAPPRSSDVPEGSWIGRSNQDS